MTRTFFVLLALLLSTFCFSQTGRVEGSFTGTIINGQDKKPLTGVSISVANKDSSVANGVLSAANGTFSLAIKDTGQYELLVSHVGFKDQLLKLQVGPDFTGWHIGSLSMQAGSGLLPEITIRASRPLVEQKADRLVYNAERDLSTLGGTAADVLRNVPMLSVDGDGNVQLRGSSSIRVLINNRPSSLIASSVADALRQLPADIIKSVEVITSPTAKYDAEGAAGIINIITKKNLLQGVTGSVSLVPGNVSTIGSGSLYFRRPQYGLNFSYGVNQFYNNGKTHLERRSFHDPMALIQEGRTRNRSGFFNPRMGFDVSFDKRNSISGGFSYNPSHANTANRQHITTEVPGQPADARNTLFVSKSSGAGYDANLDYLLTFKEPQREFSILTLYSVSRSDNLASQDDFGESAITVYQQQNKNRSTNREATLQADYTHPFQNTTTLEAGVKTILRQASSDVSYHGFNPSSADHSFLQNSFSYDQDVWSTYLLYGFRAGKSMHIKMGGRYEKTNISALFQPQAHGFSTHYHNWIPSFNAAYTLKEKHSFRVGYTQRLQRPQLYFLNPYREAVAPGVIRQGNPELDAERAHLFELGYGTTFKKGSLQASVFTRSTNNAIATSMDLRNDTTFIMFDNIATNNTYGFSVSGNAKPIKRWHVNANANLLYTKLTGNGFDNSGWMYNLLVNSLFDLGKGWWNGFTGSFNSRRVILQGRMAAFYYHNTTVRKDLKNKRGSIGINLANPFMRGTRMRTFVIAENFEQYEDNINYTRGIRLSFQYRFGKLQQTKNPRRAKKAISNDDALKGQ